MITFKNVAYNYDGGELLSEVTLRLAPGSLHFLTEPSYKDKTTLLKRAYIELLPTTDAIASIIGTLLMPSLNKANDFLTSLGFKASWMFSLLLLIIASVVTLFTTRAVAFRKLREMQ